MNAMSYSLLLFVGALLLHLIIWRIHLPKKQIDALLKIFSFVLILGIFLLFKFPGRIKWDILPSRNIYEIIQFLLLFISISVAYIVSYPAIEVDSPTLIIIKAVFEAGLQGLDKSKLEEIVDNNLLIAPRIKDMLLNKMVYLDGEKYKLMLSGLIIARIFAFYRNIIKGGKGG